MTLKPWISGKNLVVRFHHTDGKTSLLEGEQAKAYYESYCKSAVVLHGIQYVEFVEEKAGDSE